MELLAAPSLSPSQTSSHKTLCLKINLNTKVSHYEKKEGRFYVSRCGSFIHACTSAHQPPTILRGIQNDCDNNFTHINFYDSAAICRPPFFVQCSGRLGAGVGGGCGVAAGRECRNQKLEKKTTIVFFASSSFLISIVTCGQREKIRLNISTFYSFRLLVYHLSRSNFYHAFSMLSVFNYVQRHIKSKCVSLRAIWRNKLFGL